ncbi:MAG: hypothetical protein KAG61_03290 [Bacteriovoracaceae bacterium]|nr:hypothetical protein [Bacteriovoracaceae bacterium]
MDTVQNICPRCGGEGKQVPLKTVKHVVQAELQDSVCSNTYYLCMTPDCGTGYFCNSEQHDIAWSYFKRPVWFKTGADPIVACYCKNIKATEVVETVKSTDLRTVKEIMHHLRGEVGSHCEITNPQGSCCSSFFQEVIDGASAELSDSSGSCCDCNC